MLIHATTTQIVIKCLLWKNIWYVQDIPLNIFTFIKYLYPVTKTMARGWPKPEFSCKAGYKCFIRINFWICFLILFYLNFISVNFHCRVWRIFYLSKQACLLVYHTSCIRPWPTGTNLLNPCLSKLQFLFIKPCTVCTKQGNVGLKFAVSNQERVIIARI